MIDDVLGFIVSIVFTVDCFFFLSDSCHCLPALNFGDEKMDTNPILIFVCEQLLTLLLTFLRFVLYAWSSGNFTRMYLSFFSFITSKALKSLYSLLWIILFLFLIISFFHHPSSGVSIWHVLEPYIYFSCLHFFCLHIVPCCSMMFWDNLSFQSSAKIFDVPMPILLFSLCIELFKSLNNCILNFQVFLK